VTGEATRFAIPEPMAGERADKVLAAVAGISRSAARVLFASGAVTIDGRVVDAADRSGGRVIAAPIPEEEPELDADAGVPFTVRHEDAALIVVDKPAGVVVHPGAGRSSGTLAAGLLARYRDLGALPADARWGIVHRLDKDTSGLLLVARTLPALADLQGQLRGHTIGRTYLALVVGSFDNTTGTIDAPLGRDPSRPTRRSVVRDGKPARTHYRRLAWWERADLSLLEVRLETGRTHQIRVHLAAIRHPVVGDRRYGTRGQAADPGRTWLHAAALSFRHPVSGRSLVVRSPLPADLASSLDALGLPSMGALPVDSAGGETP
jgi:23S rRNA pseudouridine1911/1915/1917 synthase